MLSVMKKSNIFAYIELSKFVEELKPALASGTLKEQLRAQSAYFNIIQPKYFSDSLVQEWEGILVFSKQKGARVDDEGKVVSNAISNTIENLTSNECQKLAEKVFVLYEKVKMEFQ